MNINLENSDLSILEQLFDTREKNIELSEKVIEYIRDGKEISFLNKDKLDIKKYKDNPYLKNVKPFATQNGKIELKYSSYQPNEVFIYDDFTVDYDFNEKIALGYFEEKYDYLTLLEDNNIWMLISPNEINTMQSHIDEATGKVLVLGLGLGYFPYMISLKENVKEILIVENNQDIINLFNDNIFKYFPNKEKIKIINDDAFNVLKRANDFNFVFCDLWHDPNDGLETYCKIKKLENKFMNVKFSYWLETGILCLLRRCIITLLQEEAFGSTDEDYYYAQSFTDEVINSLHFILKERDIVDFNDVRELLSDDSLKYLCKIIKI